MLVFFLSLFYFFGGDGIDRAGLGGGCIPRRWRPKPQHTRNGCTSQAAQQTAPEPGRTTQGTTHTPRRWTRCAGRTRYQTGHVEQIAPAAGAGGRGVCPKLSRYGRHDFTIFCQKNKSEKSYNFIQKGLTYKIYLI